MQQSCGSVVLADGRLVDLIRRVATFGMVLMKLDLRQVCRILVKYCFVRSSMSEKMLINWVYHCVPKFPRDEVLRL